MWIDRLKCALFGVCLLQMVDSDVIDSLSVQEMVLHVTNGTRFHCDAANFCREGVQFCSGPTGDCRNCEDVCYGDKLNSNTCKTQCQIYHLMAKVKNFIEEKFKSISPTPVIHPEMTAAPQVITEWQPAVGAVIADPDNPWSLNAIGGILIAGLIAVLIAICILAMWLFKTKRGNMFVKKRLLLQAREPAHIELTDMMDGSTSMANPSIPQHRVSVQAPAVTIEDEADESEPLNPRTSYSSQGESASSADLTNVDATAGGVTDDEANQLHQQLDGSQTPQDGPRSGQNRHLRPGSAKSEGWPVVHKAARIRHTSQSEGDLVASSNQQSRTMPGSSETDLKEAYHEPSPPPMSHNMESADVGRAVHPCAFGFQRQISQSANEVSHSAGQAGDEMTDSTRQNRSNSNPSNQMAGVSGQGFHGLRSSSQHDSSFVDGGASCASIPGNDIGTSQETHALLRQVSSTLNEDVVSGDASEGNMSRPNFRSDSGFNSPDHVVRPRQKAIVQSPLAAPAVNAPIQAMPENPSSFQQQQEPIIAQPTDAPQSASQSRENLHLTEHQPSMSLSENRPAGVL